MTKRLAILVVAAMSALIVTGVAALAVTPLWVMLVMFVGFPAATAVALIVLALPAVLIAVVIFGSAAETAHPTPHDAP